MNEVECRTMEHLSQEAIIDAYLSLCPPGKRPESVERPEFVISNPCPMRDVWAIQGGAVYPALWFWARGNMNDAWVIRDAPSTWQARGIYGLPENMYLHQADSDHVYRTESDALLARMHDLYDEFVRNFAAVREQWEREKGANDG